MLSSKPHDAPIRVLVAVDQMFIRRGMVASLLDFIDLRLAGEARNGVELLELCRTAHPDVVLMDLLMADVGCIEAIKAIHENYPEIQVIALTNWDEHALVKRALNEGATTYLTKNARGDEMAEAIRSVYSIKPQKLEPPHHIPEVTDRELEVLILMARGLTNRQIGMKLNISRATAKFHVSSILRKIGVASRTEAVAVAIRLHIIVGPAVD